MSIGSGSMLFTYVFIGQVARCLSMCSLVPVACGLPMCSLVPVACGLPMCSLVSYDL